MSRPCKLSLFFTLASNALMKFKMNLFKLKEGREMKAETFSKLVSTSLYEKRYVHDIWLIRENLISHIDSDLTS